METMVRKSSTKCSNRVHESTIWNFM